MLWSNPEVPECVLILAEFLITGWVWNLGVLTHSTGTVNQTLVRADFADLEFDRSN